jgi:hypothetical protein
MVFVKRRALVEMKMQYSLIGELNGVSRRVTSILYCSTSAVPLVAADQAAPPRFAFGQSRRSGGAAWVQAWTWAKAVRCYGWSGHRSVRSGLRNGAGGWGRRVAGSSHTVASVGLMRGSVANSHAIRWGFSRADLPGIRTVQYILYCTEYVHS